MKVELLLSDDVELRAYIKELIKNEVINISREEIKKTVEEVLTKKVNNISNLDKLTEASINHYVAMYMKAIYGYPSTATKQELINYINNRIQELVTKQLGEFTASVTANIIRELSKNNEQHTY